MKIKGKLLIIGGAEDKGDDEEIIDANNINKNAQRYEILKSLLKSSNKKHIEIITAGSTVPHEVEKAYKEAFLKIGFAHPQFLHIENKREANNKKVLDRVQLAEVVFFTGGDQTRLVKKLEGTKLVALLKEKYHHDANFLLAGTSAGAMFLSSIMIANGGKREVLIESDLKLKPGLDFLSSCIIDTHFIKRGRFGRLIHAITLHPDMLGIGLGEDTALLIEEGSIAECRGSGAVVIIDGKHIKDTNIGRAENGIPLYVDNVIVHWLVKGCKFSLNSRKLLFK